MTAPETPGAADLAQRLTLQSETALCPGAHIALVEETLGRGSVPLPEALPQATPLRPAPLKVSRIRSALEALRVAGASRTALGMREGGRLVGSVRGFVVEGVGHIERLMVHSLARGRGLGRALMAAVEAALDAPADQRFTGARSAGKIALYRRPGYEMCGSSGRGGVPLVILKKHGEVQA